MSRAGSLADIVAAGKAKPGEVTFSTTGNGTVGHLTGELPQRIAAVKYVHVPYKGSAQALPDLIGGRINFFLASLETAMPQMKAGTIRTVASELAKWSRVIREAGVKIE